MVDIYCYIYICKIVIIKIGNSLYDYCLTAYNTPAFKIISLVFLVLSLCLCPFLLTLLINVYCLFFQ